VQIATHNRCHVDLKVSALIDQQLLSKGVRAVKQPSHMMPISMDHAACCVATVLQLLRRLTAPAAGHSLRQRLAITCGFSNVHNVFFCVTCCMPCI
jgi:hypothetical protein